MLEIFLRDRKIDFEFIVFTNNEIKYITKNNYNINNQTKSLYHSLKNGTIILDGMPITIENASEKQIEYISNISEKYKDKYEMLKKSYKPRFVGYTSGNDAIDIFFNSKTIEIPDPRYFKEWAYIKGFEYL